MKSTDKKKSQKVKTRKTAASAGGFDGYEDSDDDSYDDSDDDIGDGTTTDHCVPPS